MLVQNPRQTTIMSYKLSSGEEIIARVQENGPHPTIVNPLMMILVPGEGDNSQGLIAFTPWMLAANDDTPMKLNGANIITSTPAREDAVAQYLQLVQQPSDSRGGAENETHTTVGGKGK